MNLPIPKAETNDTTMSKKTNTLTDYQLNKEISNDYNLAKNVYNVFYELVERGMHSAFAMREGQEFRFTENPPIVRNPSMDDDKMCDIKAIYYKGGMVYVRYLHGSKTDICPLSRLTTYDQYRMLGILSENCRYKRDCITRGEWRPLQTEEKIISMY